MSSGKKAANNMFGFVGGVVSGIKNATEIPAVKEERNNKEKEMNELENDYKMSNDLSNFMMELEELIGHNEKIIKNANTMRLLYENEKSHFDTIRDNCEKQNSEFRTQINGLKNKIITEKVYNELIIKLTDERDELNKKLSKLRK